MLLPSSSYVQLIIENLVSKKRKSWTSDSYLPFFSITEILLLIATLNDISCRHATATAGRILRKQRYQTVVPNKHCFALTKSICPVSAVTSI